MDGGVRRTARAAARGGRRRPANGERRRAVGGEWSRGSLSIGILARIAITGRSRRSEEEVGRGGGGARVAEQHARSRPTRSRATRSRPTTDEQRATRRTIRSVAIPTLDSTGLSAPSTRSKSFRSFVCSARGRACCGRGSESICRVRAPPHPRTAAKPMLPQRASPPNGPNGSPRPPRANPRQTRRSRLSEVWGFVSFVRGATMLVCTNPRHGTVRGAETSAARGGSGRHGAEVDGSVRKSTARCGSRRHGAESR